MDQIDNLSFSPLEESISFYTRNDFAIMNHLLVGNYKNLWKYALAAYNDNKAVLDEYLRGERTIDNDYDIKWVNSLKSRILNDLNEDEKQLVLNNAKNDIYNILKAMYPAKNDMYLYRTSWIDKGVCKDNHFPYSREYKSLHFGVGNLIDIKIISSFSLTPYREDDDVGSQFYRYEMEIQKNTPVLELNKFITHNEEGEVLLPPMRCKVIDIAQTEHKNCKGIIKLQYIEQLK